MRFVIATALLTCATAVPSDAGVLDTLTRVGSRDAIERAMERVRPDFEGTASQAVPKATSIATSECKRTAFNSTVIRVAEFCKMNTGNYLDIGFVNSTTYRYFDVPAATYEALIRASSAGRFFNAGIRNQYRCERISFPPRARGPQGCE